MQRCDTETRLLRSPAPLKTWTSVKINNERRSQAHDTAVFHGICFLICREFVVCCKWCILATISALILHFVLWKHLPHLQRVSHYFAYYMLIFSSPVVEQNEISSHVSRRPALRCQRTWFLLTSLTVGRAAASWLRGSDPSPKKSPFFFHTYHAKRHMMLFLFPAFLYFFY